MALARFATVAKAQAVARMPLERRTATLLAFVRTLEATAQDDVLDLFDIRARGGIRHRAACGPGGGAGADRRHRPTAR
jgi:hypothetical protein